MKLAILGATGRTGRLVVERALAAGHTVRALARDPERLGIRHERLVVLEGDAASAAKVREVCEGMDAVVSAVGPGERDICSRTTGHVLAAARAGGPRRYLVVSGAATEAPGDEKGMVGRAVSGFVRSLFGGAAADKQRDLDLLLASDIDWTAVRPPWLVDGGRDVARVSRLRAPSWRCPRAALAAFIVEELEHGRHLRAAPFVAQ